MKILEKVIKLSTSFDTTRQEVSSLEFEEERLLKETFERINTEKGKNVSKYQVIASYAGDKKQAKVWLFGEEAHVLEDIARPGAPIKKYGVTKKGALQNPKPSGIKIIEKKLVTYTGKSTEITGETLKSLRTILAGDVKLVLG